MNSQALAVIDEIKRVWRPGYSTAKIASLVNPALFRNKQPSRSAIIGYYSRYRPFLLICPLPPQNLKVTRSKKLKAEPKPRINRVPQAPRPQKKDESTEDYFKAITLKPKRIGRPRKQREVAEGISIQSRSDPEFAARQERRWRVEQMMLDREPIQKKHKDIIHKISLSRIGGR